MDEKTILKISVSVTFIGIVILFFYLEFFDLDSSDIWELNEKDIDREVKIVGRVERVTDLNKTMFLTIYQEKPEEISVVLFKDSNVSVSEGDKVSVVGTVEEYKGKLEIICNQLEKLDSR